ncbi:MAG: macro domain-containing protein [Spirochaetes bacterium]|uniref:Macro domain-containing protein n=1 Tax=Candidatus Avitreponema avistercoris TaxID=2840705 RepID=A0A9D9EM87_9SPIR|nr:macro domain-containing protein [Candidatus Avitreponema avistercoris]
MNSRSAAKEKSGCHFQIVFSGVSGKPLFHFRQKRSLIRTADGNRLQLFQIGNFCFRIFQIFRRVVGRQNQRVSFFAETFKLRNHRVGVQLRLECARIMAAQKTEEPAARAKITDAYNLPCRHVLHTVGPVVYGSVTQQNRAELAGCYRSCLELAAADGLDSAAFCCISTGEFRFPNQAAAEIAVETVRAWQREHPGAVQVIFNVFKETDYDIYRKILGAH